eukprot:6002844-Prymnesium_polylepis.1
MVSPIRAAATDIGGARWWMQVRLLLVAIEVPPQSLGCETGVTLRHRGPDSRRTGTVVYAFEHVNAVEHDTCALGGPYCAVCLSIHVRTVCPSWLRTGCGQG